ncbi:MAG: serine protease [Bacillota bacterium]|nr:serine protease [Bacillota bacterium]MDW7684853.1 serine protease [Bacillota bacterium]
MSKDDLKFSPDETDLDKQLIHDLNRLYEDDSSGRESVRNTRFFKVASILTILIFLALVFNNWLMIIRLPSLDFLERSRELTRDPKLRTLREAVVEIHTGNSRGTGFNIAADGIIITNYHVVKNAASAQVNFIGERTYTGVIAALYPEIDLAVVSVKEEDLPAIEVETDSEMSAGDSVTIIGNPLWFSGVIIEGEVLGKTVLQGWDVPVLLIRAPVHKGNSGSPVLNSRGKAGAVIFATSVVKNGEKEEIIGLAVPLSNLNKEVVR